MGNEARFRELFGEHHLAVARYVQARGAMAADADDLIAGTFEIAWRRLDHVPSGREALPWLLTVARNLSRNAHRKGLREQSLMERLMAEPRPSGQDDRAMRHREKVLEALAALRPVDRDLFLLVAWDELGPSEAGQVLGLSPVAARSRLHRARRRLAELLETDNDGDDTLAVTTTREARNG